MHTIRKSNKVIEAQYLYSMTTSELRLIFLCISKIGFEEEINDDSLFVISSLEYGKIFDLDPSNARKDLRKAVEKLWQAEIDIDRNNDDPLTTRWISSKVKYKSGDVHVRFAKDIIPYLTQLKKLLNEKKDSGFTVYQLESIAKIKSNHSIRIYELLKQYEKIGKRRLEVDFIRKALCLTDKYKVMGDFKKRVIDLAVKEINANSDIEIKYTQEKTKSAITAFVFSIKSKRKPTSNEQFKKKFLKPADVDELARVGEDYKDLYHRLEKAGYTFNRVA